MIIKNASSVQSGGYAITCECFNHNIYSIGWNLFFSTKGIRLMQAIPMARVLIPGYHFTFVRKKNTFAI